MGSMLQA